MYFFHKCVWIWIFQTDSDVWIWIFQTDSDSDSDIWIWIFLTDSDSDRSKKSEEKVLPKKIKEKSLPKNIKTNYPPKNLERNIPSQKVGKRNLYPKKVWIHFKRSIFDDDMFLTKISLKRNPCQTNFNRNLYPKKWKKHVYPATLWREVCTKQFSK